MFLTAIDHSRYFLRFQWDIFHKAKAVKSQQCQRFLKLFKSFLTPSCQKPKSYLHSILSRNAIMSLIKSKP